jgi:hypothetical protein
VFSEEKALKHDLHPFPPLPGCIKHLFPSPLFFAIWVFISGVRQNRHQRNTIVMEGLCNGSRWNHQGALGVVPTSRWQEAEEALMARWWSLRGNKLRAWHSLVVGAQRNLIIISSIDHGPWSPCSVESVFFLFILRFIYFSVYNINHLYY